MALFSKSEKTMYNRSDMAEKDGHTHLAIYTVSGLLMGTNRFDEKATAPLEDVLQRMQKDGYEIRAQRSLAIEECGSVTAQEPVFREITEPTLRDTWKRYCRANAIPPVTLYELRHTFISIASLLPAGEVKMLVGHSRSMDTFGTYGHHIQTYDQMIADDLSGLFDNLLG